MDDSLPAKPGFWPQIHRSEHPVEQDKLGEYRLVAILNAEMAELYVFCEGSMQKKEAKGKVRESLIVFSLAELSVDASGKLMHSFSEKPSSSWFECVSGTSVLLFFFQWVTYYCVLRGDRLWCFMNKDTKNPHSVRACVGLLPC